MRFESAFGMYQGTSSSLISPSRVRREGRNWHLTATKDVARLPWLHRACPSATLDKKSVFSCSADYIRCPISGANKDYSSQLSGTLPVHDERIELAQLAEIDEVGSSRLRLGQPF